MFIHGSAVDCVGEPSETDGRALGVERLARQTAEVAQQTVERWPAGVDAEEIGTLPMFNGDIDLSDFIYSMPWSQWSRTVRSFFGKVGKSACMGRSVGDRSKWASLDSQRV